MHPFTVFLGYYFVALCDHCESRSLLDKNVVTGVLVAFCNMFFDDELRLAEASGASGRNTIMNNVYC